MHTTWKKLLCVTAISLTPFAVYAGGTNTQDNATTGYKNDPDRTTEQGDRGRSTGNTATTAKIDDSELENKVEKAIENDAQLRNLDIDVDAENGVVKLSGDVSDVRWKGRATKVASSVRGVKSVQNELSVKN